MSPSPRAVTGTCASVTVDVLVTWIAAAVVLRYFWTLTRRLEQSSLERRTRFLLGAIGLMLFLRGFVWLSPATRWLAVLSLVPATLLPLSMTSVRYGDTRDVTDRPVAKQVRPTNCT